MKHNYRTLLLGFLIFISSIRLYSQDKLNAKEYFIEAESYFLFEEYTDALPLYQKVVREEPENYNVIYKIGICYLNNPYQKAQAFKYLLEASEHISDDYKNTYKEKNAPLDVKFYIGQAYRANNELDKALEYYTDFQKALDPNIFDVEYVNSEIESCERAKKAVRTPVYMAKHNFGKTVNTKFAESNVVLSGDGKTLVFNRALQFYNAVFVTYLQADGKWSKPYNLTSDFGLDGDSYCTGISYDGGEILVYRSDNFDGNIYTSKKSSGKWQKLQKLNNSVNTKYWESHASLSPDGQYLYFTSNRKGGYGGLDIYKSKRSPNGGWDKPVNLGPVVNSAFNEEAPFISPNGQNLFFSSLGHNSIGGYDLYISKLAKGGEWSRPVNMGYPFNTTDDDIFYCPVEKGPTSGIKSIYDPSSTFGLTDIYWIEVFNDQIPRTFNIKGQVNVPQKDILTFGKVLATLIDPNQGKTIKQIHLDEQGEFEFETSQGNYQLLVNGENIKPITIPVELKVSQKNSNIELPLISAQLLEKGEESAPIVIRKPAKLELVGSEYIVTNTIPVQIDLILTKGSDLAVEVSSAGKLLDREEYIVSKEKFNYRFIPQEGENKIIFKSRDDEGNENQQEVLVYYQPEKEEVAITAENNPLIEFAEIAGLTNSNLAKYLISLPSDDFSSLVELYKMLMDEAEENNYSKKNVEELIKVLLTQRDSKEFLENASGNTGLEELTNNDSLYKTPTYPLSIVRNLKNEKEPIQQEKINIGLVDMIPYQGEKYGLSLYILSFLKEPAPLTSSFNTKGDTTIYHSLCKKVGAGRAIEIIELSSTTENLDQFLNNLLINSSNELFAILRDIDLDSLQVYNSIDLVDYLFNEANNKGIGIAEIIAEIEAAQLNKAININRFREALAEVATGQLKLELQNMQLEVNEIKQLNEVIENLTKQAKSNNYSKAGIYELMIKMIGYKTAKEFIAALQDNSNGKLDNVLSEIKTEEYSLPIEVIQYLLAQNPYFDYTDSDINNLLIKMLLEQGLDSWKLPQEKTFSKEFIKKGRGITTIVLVSLFMIILIILIIRKKRKED